MKMSVFLHCTAVSMVAAAGFVIDTSPAVAKEADRAMEEIVVVEAPIERRLETGRSTLGAKIEVIHLVRRVSYSDLDLARQTDVIEMETRIETIAKESCEKLSEMFPFEKGDHLDCIKKAIGGTQQQLQSAIAAAE